MGVHEKILLENPEFNFSQLNQQMRSIWRSMRNTEFRQPYLDKARQLQDAYDVKKLKLKAKFKKRRTE